MIACGGGGIPVIEQNHILKGASAVIEKDAIAGKLAADLKADQLIILTNVDCVYTDYGKETAAPISSMNEEQAKAYIAEGQFEAGSHAAENRGCYHLSGCQSGGQCTDYLPGSCKRSNQRKSRYCYHPELIFRHKSESAPPGSTTK